MAVRLGGRIYNPPDDPLELARAHGLDIEGEYADACHLCDSVRRRIRPRYPATLVPDQMYGVV